MPPAARSQDADLDHIRAERLQQLREAGKPHAFDASNDGLRCAHAGGNCGLPPQADVHDPAARGDASRMEPVRLDVAAPKSRREQDALRRQAKRGPPQPHWAPVAVVGDPAGRLDVQVGQGSLPCEEVHIERTMAGAWLVLKVPLAHCAVHLRKPAATARVVQEDHDGAPPQIPEPEAQPPSPAGVVPEAQPNGAPASVANAMDSAIEQGIVLPADPPASTGA